MLDIEGAELAALKGASRRLELPRGRAPRLVFEVHRSYTDWSAGLQSTAILSYLADLATAPTPGARLPVEPRHGRPPYRAEALDERPPTSTSPLRLHVMATKDPSVIDGRFVVSPGVSPKLLAHREPALHHPAGGL